LSPVSQVLVLMPSLPRDLNRERFMEEFNLSLARGRPGIPGRVKQKDVAALLGVNIQTISRWSRGETLPSDDHVDQLRRLFDWSDATYAALHGVIYDERAFEDWRSAVGLPTTFPRLEELREPATEADGGFFVDRLHREQLVELLESIGSRHLAVNVPPGHGATTLARHVARVLAADSVVRRSIPVLVSLEDLVDRSYASLRDAQIEFLRRAHPRASKRIWSADPALFTEADEAADAVFAELKAGRVHAALADALRDEVVLSLVARPFERVTGKRAYAELLGVEVEAIDGLRADLRRWIDLSFDRGLAVRRLGRHAPRLLERPAEDLAVALSEHFGIRVCLVLDLSPTPMGRQKLADGEYLTGPYRKVAARFSAELHALVERWRPSLDTVTFAPAQTQPDWADGVQTMAFAPYRGIDLFEMLSQRYDHHLAALLDIGHVELDAETGITTALAVLEQRLRDAAAAHEPMHSHAQGSWSDDRARIKDLESRVARLEARLQETTGAR
jgi:transcriptional regulator with XRE-family HTH domain